MKSDFWPVTLREQLGDHAVELRPMRARRDRLAWSDVRAANRDWTGPWDSTTPDAVRVPDFRRAVKEQNTEAHAGRMLPWLLVVDGEIAGQVHVFSIVWGAQRGGTIGYWIARKFAGQGITPLGVAMAIDHCFGELGLHRIEINIRPENVNSLRVVEKLGLRDEGVRRNFLHIAGQWRDHRTFAVTADEVGAGGMRGRIPHRVSEEKYDTPGVPHSL